MKVGTVSSGPAIDHRAGAVGDRLQVLVGAALVGLALSACTPGGSPGSGAAGGTAPPGAAQTPKAPGAVPAPGTTPPPSADATSPTRDDADIALVATTSAVRARSATDEPLELAVRVRNDTGRTLELLLWNTPFEETPSADLFAITRDGEAVPYRGRLIKRAVPPAPEHFARLAPGETLERTVDLARDYGVERPGTYRIRFAPPPVAADGGPVRLAGDGREIVVERR